MANWVMFQEVTGEMTVLNMDNALSFTQSRNVHDDVIPDQMSIAFPGAVAHVHGDFESLSLILNTSSFR